MNGNPLWQRLSDLLRQLSAEALIQAGLLKNPIIGSSEAIFYANCNTPAEWRCYVIYANIHD